MLRTIALGLIVTSLAGSATAGWPGRQLLERRAEELGTDGPSSHQAHEILVHGIAEGFSYPTILVGIEKAPRHRIRRQAAAGRFRSAREAGIVERLGTEAESQCRPTQSAQQKRLCTLARQQQRKAEGYFDDGKRTFVSHVAVFPQAHDADSELLYSAYVDCSDPDQASAHGYDCTATAYDNGWRALAQLDARIVEMLSAPTPEPFTHLLLVSKGWNTRQSDSVDYFRKITCELSAVAAAEEVAFRPLVVGITWHSGWVWFLSKIPLLNVFPKAASYGNKAKDADEIGLTWANELLNRTLIPAGHRAGVPVVAIGHSFGARVLSRAAASRHLLAEPPPEGELSLLVSLQGAFSMNRFLSERCAGREGAPYSELSRRVSRVAVIWSGRDLTNPLAQVASGANHAGGRPAFSRARAYAGRFAFRSWGPGWEEMTVQAKDPGEDRECSGYSPPPVPAIELVEATSIVKSHGDVGDAQMAKLLWALLPGID